MGRKDRRVLLVSADDKQTEALVPAKGDSLLRHIGVNDFLESIRPVWQSRALIERVRKILPVDPSSACQRLFNAAIHDLREKVVVAVTLPPFLVKS